METALLISDLQPEGITHRTIIFRVDENGDVRLELITALGVGWSGEEFHCMSGMLSHLASRIRGSTPEVWLGEVLAKADVATKLSPIGYVITDSEWAKKMTSVCQVEIEVDSP